VRAILDVNILVASLLSRSGAPALLVRRWLAGDFELIVSEALLNELERAVAYPKLRQRIAVEDGAAFVALLRDTAILAADPQAGRLRSADPADDYLLALAEQERAFLVSGDKHVLDLAGALPIGTAQDFLIVLQSVP
jgi:putative PIN family toxin of toxin-antitoxin system